MDEFERLYEVEREREESFRHDSLSHTEWLVESVHHYAAVYGAEEPEKEYILSPFDTWHPNPYYTGRKGPHPEDDDFWSLSPEEQEAEIERLNAPRPVYSPPPPRDDDLPF